MFKTLKQKIAKETGQSVENLTFHNTTSTRHSISSINSQQNSLDSSKDENYMIAEDVSVCGFYEIDFYLGLTDFEGRKND